MVVVVDRFRVVEVVWRGWWRCATGNGGLVLHELLENNRSSRHIRRRVFLGKDLRWLAELLGQRHQSGVLLKAPLCVEDLLAAKDSTGKGKRSSCHNRGLRGNKVSVVQGDLADVPCHVLQLDVLLGSVGKGELKEAIHGGVSNNPVEGVEYVPLHLGEHLFVVEHGAHALELSDQRHPVLAVTILGGNEQGSTANELIVTLVDDTTGTVSVEEVHGEEHCLG